MLSLCRLYLLCLTPGEGLAVGKGELLLIICAVLFSGHILVIDHFSPLVDGVKMSCIQFLVCGILSGVPALLFEQSESFRNLSRTAPDSLCRSYVKRRSLHPADRRPEKHEPDSCFPDSQPGILYFRACRMDNPRTALKQPRNLWLRSDVWCDHSCTVAAERICSFYKYQTFFINIAKKRHHFQNCLVHLLFYLNEYKSSDSHLHSV